MSEAKDLFARAVGEFDRRVKRVDANQWSDPTPCTDWSVRDLVNHLVYENKWAPPILAGKTIEEVGRNAFEGDLLGDDPQTVWIGAAQEAIDAVGREGTEERTVHVSFGDIPGRHYISQLLSDHVIHAWDLAQGIGDDDQIDPELVEFAFKYLEPYAQTYRGAGAFGDEVEVDPEADPQTKLLGLAGRQA
jgi:uncharacterized protein (TIGR03086 family)